MNVAQRTSFWMYSFIFWVLLAIASVTLLYFKRDKLRFGIDLVGGTYITLAVQTDKAVEDELAEVMQSLVVKLKKAGIPTPSSKVVEKEQIIYTFDSPDAVQKASSYITLQEAKLQQQALGSELRLRFDDRTAQRIKDNAVRTNVEVLHTRLNALGVEETPVAVQGERNIVVELPGIDDPQRAKAMIGKVAKLEFKLVEGEGPTREDILYKLEGEVVPADKEILYSSRDREYYLVSRYTDISGKLLKDAKAGMSGGEVGQVAIHFTFNDVGSERFYEMTKKNYGRRIAIILDGDVLMAPVVKTAIRGGGEITGGFSSAQAHEYSALLKSGAFAGKVTFEEERQIGPSLGSESIRKGLLSCLIGLLLLLVFAIFYYRGLGVLAFIVLVYNLLLIMVGLYFMGATLTLPGIAGMVLTIGMAIDASILIYERIRETLASGVTVHKAVNEGFADAMRVILDANITTLLTGIVLYIFGTGPIQGFAVTMMLGIISTLLTGLFLLKTLLNVIIDTFHVQRLNL